MKITLVHVFTVVLALGCLLCAKSALADNKGDWMKLLPDALPICKLSIPGTHDSGAIYGGCMLKTQDSGISSQLQQGIRAFDIRLAEKDGRLGVFHSHAFQNTYWETDVLPSFIEFLKEHPSEMLIVSLKREGGAVEAYASLVAASLSATDVKSFFVWDFNKDLLLGDCRGRILFLHRDLAMDEYPGAVCKGWADDATCLMTLCGKNGAEAQVLLQDEYQYVSDKEVGQKVEACISNLGNVATEPDSSYRWGISFVSATGLPKGTPEFFASEVNKQVAEYLKKSGKQVRGIVFIDFVQRPEGVELVGSLIKEND